MRSTVKPISVRLYIASKETLEIENYIHATV